MIIAGVPARVGVRLGKERVDQNAIALRIRVRVAQDADRIDDGSAPGTAREPTDQVECCIGGPTGLEILDLRLHLLPIGICLARKKKPP